MELKVYPNDESNGSQIKLAEYRAYYVGLVFLFFRLNCFSFFSSVSIY